MTKEQLDYLRRVLDPTSASAPKDQLNNPSGRSRRVHTKAEVSLGTVLRRNEYCGPTDWRG